MKVRYSAKTNTLNVVLKDNTPVHESDGDKPGFILNMLRYLDRESAALTPSFLQGRRRKPSSPKPI